MTPSTVPAHRSRHRAHPLHLPQSPGDASTAGPPPNAEPTTRDPSSDAPWPRLVGHYRLDGPLGRGEQGQVFAAWDTVLLRPVALKRLRMRERPHRDGRPSGLDDHDATERPPAHRQQTGVGASPLATPSGRDSATPIASASTDVDHAAEAIPSDQADHEAHLREARRSAGLRHAAFVRIHGVVSESVAGRAAHWIVMERVFGRAMSQVLTQKPLPVAQAVELMAQAASALAELHAEGLVHGDIKPANLMLQDDGQLRIVDFGIAQRVDPLATLTELPGGTLPAAGTLAYLAPERLMGASPGPASEIFTLGAVFLELIGGRRAGAPQADETAPLDVAALLAGSDRWTFPPDVPAALAQLIRAMGARDPADRPRDLDTVARWLTGLQVERTVPRHWRDEASDAGLGEPPQLPTRASSSPPVHSHDVQRHASPPCSSQSSRAWPWRRTWLDALRACRMEAVLLSGVMAGLVLGAIPGALLGLKAGQSAPGGNSASASPARGVGGPAPLPARLCPSVPRTP